MSCYATWTDGQQTLTFYDPTPDFWKCEYARRKAYQDGMLDKVNELTSFFGEVLERASDKEKMLAQFNSKHELLALHLMKNQKRFLKVVERVCPEVEFIDLTKKACDAVELSVRYGVWFSELADDSLGDLSRLSWLLGLLEAYYVVQDYVVDNAKKNSKKINNHNIEDRMSSEDVAGYLKEKGFIAEDSFLSVWDGEKERNLAFEKEFSTSSPTYLYSPCYPVSNCKSRFCIDSLKREVLEVSVVDLKSDMFDVDYTVASISAEIYNNRISILKEKMSCIDSELMRLLSSESAFVAQRVQECFCKLKVATKETRRSLLTDLNIYLQESDNKSILLRGTADYIQLAKEVGQCIKKRNTHLQKLPAGIKNKKSKRARAIGLLLWDLVHVLGASQTEAIDYVEEQCELVYPYLFSYKVGENFLTRESFRKWLTVTEESIESGLLLPISG